VNAILAYSDFIRFVFIYRSPFHARIATTSPEKAGFSSTEPRA
jgi:hypothetical protein